MTDEAPTAPLEPSDEWKSGFESGYASRASLVVPTNPKEEAPMFKTPDITPVQAVAVVGAVLAAAAAFGFDLTSQQQDSVMQLVAVVAALLLGGDAVIRHGRATGSAKKDG